MSTPTLAPAAHDPVPVQPHWRSPRGPLEPVMKQHAHEVAARWARRTASGDAHDITFEQRLREDRFLLAHIDALRIGGPAAQPMIERYCREASGGDVFARHIAALLAGQTPNSPPAATVDAQLCIAFWHAPLWLNDEELQLPLRSHLASTCPQIALQALRLAARLRLPVTELVEHHLTDREDSNARRCACHAAGDVGGSGCIPSLLAALDDPDPAVATAAACAAFRLGDRDRSVAILTRAVEEAERAGPAHRLLVAGLSLDDSRSLLESDAVGALPIADRIALAEGSCDLIHLGWLCALLDTAALRAAAAGAISTLAGVDDDALTVEDDVAAGSHARQALRAIDAAALPPTSARRWLGGNLLGKRTVFDTLLFGRLRARRVAALHLSLGAPHLPVLDVDAPAPRQLGWMTADEDNFSPGDTSE